MVFTRGQVTASSNSEKHLVTGFVAYNLGKYTQDALSVKYLIIFGNNFGLCRGGTYP